MASVTCIDRGSPIVPACSTAEISDHCGWLRNPNASSM